MTSDPNKDQREFWSQAVGPKWVALQADLDFMAIETSQELLRRVALTEGERVLDVGCGTGDNTLMAAQAVGPKGTVVGLDISARLLELAEKRANGLSQVQCILADAQTARFPGAGFDAVLSRFGLMFFSDPVQAIANIRSSLRPGGRLVFATYATVDQNPAALIPRTVAQSILGPLPNQAPSRQGQFAFSDIEMVNGILRNAGFRAPTGQAVSLFQRYRGNAENAAAFIAQLGPIEGLMKLHNGTPEDFSEILQGMSDAFLGFEKGNEVHIPATINFFAATND